MGLKVCIAATHPIQYHVPWFRLLCQVKDIDLQVMFLRTLSELEQGRGFGVPFTWDIPLLDGYSWTSIQKRLTFTATLPSFFSGYIHDAPGLLREMRVDVLLLTGWQIWPLIQLAYAAKSVGIPTVVRGETSSLKPRPAWIGYVHRFLMRNYDAFLTIGKANERFYQQQGVEPRRLFACKYFIDNHRFIASANLARAERDVIRQRFNVPRDAVCFLFAGKLERKKRPLDFLEALTIALAKDPSLQVHALIAGNGPLMNDARQYCEARNLPVSFAGFLNQTEIPAAYVGSDCLVLPSDYGETWGLVVNEAMASGIPAIVSDQVGCSLDLIDVGVTGWTFPCGETDRLADLIIYAARQRSELETMGARARSLVATEYSVEKAVDATVAAIQYVSSRR